jgi:hypothetical protein
MSSIGDDELAAAHEFRAQQQARFGTLPTHHTPLTSEQKERAIAHLLRTFPLMTREEVEADLNRPVQLDTAFDEELSQTIMLTLGKLMEAAVPRIDFLADMGGGVSAGFLHGPGLAAMQQRVMLTDASVILLTEHLWILCHRLARTIAGTWPHFRDEEGIHIIEDAGKVIEHLIADREAQRLWNELFLDFSIDPAGSSRGCDLLLDLSPEQIIFAHELSEAMMLFVLGHEYGHHLARHSLLGGEISSDGQPKAEAHAQEKEADFIGAVLCMEIGNEPAPDTRFWAFTNVGAILVLAVLEYIRRGAHILATGEEPMDLRSNTHPTLIDRVLTVRLATDNYVDGVKEICRHTQALFSEVIDFIWSQCAIALADLHRKGKRPVEQESGGWLPW